MGLAEAVAAHREGKLADAERLYREVLTEHPQHADACALLGVVIGARNGFAEAIDWENKAVALDPKSPLLRFHRGTVLMAAQKLPEALEDLRYAAENDPKVPQFHFNLGNAMRASEDWKGAIEHYREACRLNPRFSAAINNLCLSLIHEESYDEAFQLAKRCVALDATYGDGWLSLCNVADKLKDYATSLTAGEKAVHLMPGNHFAWFGYAVALNRLNRDDEAIAAYKKALELNPDRANIWDNLAQTYQALNRLEDAEEAFRKCIEAAGQVIPNEVERKVDEDEYGDRHWHYALIQLLRGNYKDGFKRYRARGKAIKPLARKPMPMPLWQGEDLKGKTLLVCDEQGFGDTLMLARFMPFVRAKANKVWFQVQPALQSFFRQGDYADTILSPVDALPNADYYCSSFDLPYLLDITLENLPNAVPYLPVLPPDANARLPETGFKVGVIWGGSPLHLSDRKRSIPLSLFSDLFTIEGATFYSFNRDLKSGDARLLPTLPVKDLVPLFKNFEDSARLINQMDLVISCDTATAHLAGGLGKKLWVMLPFAPDWRWMINRDDTPWYPTARLFRQPKPEDWQSVILQIRSELTNLVSTNS